MTIDDTYLTYSLPENIIKPSFERIITNLLKNQIQGYCHVLFFLAVYDSFIPWPDHLSYFSFSGCYKVFLGWTIYENCLRIVSMFNSM